MKAAYIETAGAPLFGDFIDPKPDGEGIVVDICAAALTNLDIAIAEGRHYFSSPSFPQVVGREAVGRTQDGRRLYFNVNSMIAPFGAMAQKALVREQFALPVPDGIDDVRAAALGNAGLAAWLPLSWRAQMTAGEKVLIIGATGASGLIAVAAAKLLGAGRIVAAGRSHDALAKALRLGADETVDLANGADLAAAFREAARGEVDVVIDYLNGPPAEAALRVMAKGGRMVQIGQMLAPGIHVPAALARRQSLDILGFAYYHAPMEAQAAAYDVLCRHSMAGRIEIATDTHSLRDISETWAAQKAGSRARLVLKP